MLVRRLFQTQRRKDRKEREIKKEEDERIIEQKRIPRYAGFETFLLI
jgi:hypothetical protein